MSYKPVDRQILITTEAPTTNPPNGIVYQWVDNDGFLHQMDNTGNDRRYVDLNELSQKVSTVDIVDDLNSVDTDKPLSANQGKILQDNKEPADNTILKESDVEDGLNSTSVTNPLSANQGKELESRKIDTDLSLNYGYVAEYNSRVMQEGGTIQNGRNASAPFISPTYEDAKMLLNASGGLDIAEDGERKVINKIWDSSQEKNNQVFAGSDRPEFTDYGFESVDVEKESENAILHSNNFEDDTWTKSNINLTSESIISPIGLGYKIAQLDETTTHYIRQTGEVEEGTAYCISCFVKKSEINKAWLYIVSSNKYGFVSFNLDTGGVETVNDPTNSIRYFSENMGNGWFRLAFSFIAPEIDSGGCGIGLEEPDSISGDGSSGIYISGLQLEQSAYPTNYIPTQDTTVTRLAPSPVIENALPETGGSVMGVVSLIRPPDTGTRTYIFNAFNADQAKESRFWIRAESNDDIILNIFGRSGAQTLPNPIPSWSGGTRKTISYSITYSSESLMLKILAEGILYTLDYGQHTIDDATDNQITLGATSSGARHTSNRYERIWEKDDIVRINYTDEQWKQFFEKLTLGTSQQIKASEITIAP